jgi:8-oxo-dGTP diphosphatase
VKNKNIRIRVAGIALNNRNELLVVNHQKNGKSYWLFPGGGVEYGETLAQALRRKFHEELSLKSLDVRELALVNDTIYPRNKRHILNLYFLVKLKKGQKIRVKPDRVLKGAEFVSIKKFKRFLFYPGIKSDIINGWKSGFKKCLGYKRIKWKS